MKTLEFGPEATLSQILESMKAAEDENLEVSLPKGSTLLSNTINREIIEKFAKKIGKGVAVKSASLVGEEEPEDFDFVEGEDILAKKTLELGEGPVLAPSESLAEEPVESKKPSYAQQPPSKKPPSGPFKFLSGLKGRKKLLFFGAFGGTPLLILAFVFTWFLPSADVKITVEKDTKTNQITLTASAEATEVDVENRIVPLKVEEVTKSDVDEGEATGKLVIGTPAKGRVTVGNYSPTFSRKFEAGTMIKTVSGPAVGLEFTLDTAVQVPKASFSGIGKAGVNVTAKKIGSEGNLPASTEFQIGNESSDKFIAVNDLPFTGGDSKEIAAVSEEDRKKLKEELLDKLSKEAKEELQQKLEGSTIPEGGLQVEVTKEKYDKAVGEEAKTFSLTLEVKATAKLFQEEDLKKVLVESIKPSVPEGFVVDEAGSTVGSEISQTEGEDVEILGKIKAVLIPDIKKDDLKKQLSGKNFGSAASHLQSLKNISGFEIEVKPGIFRIFKFMPFNASKINIVISEVKKDGE